MWNSVLKIKKTSRRFILRHFNFVRCGKRQIKNHRYKSRLKRTGKENSMDAILKKKGEVSIVSIHGSLDIEKTQPFKETCEKLFKGKKIIFNMEAAHFVGSTGIQSFIETMKILGASSDSGLLLVGLKPEFHRIFTNLEIQGLKIYETETAALEFLTLPVVPAIHLQN